VPDLEYLDADEAKAGAGGEQGADQALRCMSDRRNEKWPFAGHFSFVIPAQAETTIRW
jgi:hypothetical protein